MGEEAQRKEKPGLPNIMCFSSCSLSSTSVVHSAGCHCVLQQAWSDEDCDEDIVGKNIVLVSLKASSFCGSVWLCVAKYASHLNTGDSLTVSLSRSHGNMDVKCVVIPAKSTLWISYTQGGAVCVCACVYLFCVCMVMGEMVAGTWVKLKHICLLAGAICSTEAALRRLMTCFLGKANERKTDTETDGEIPKQVQLK